MLAANRKNRISGLPIIPASASWACVIIRKRPSARWKGNRQGSERYLLAMATGTGKTRTAIAMMFRLIQSRSVLNAFSSLRIAVGEQALGAFEDTRINGDTFNSTFPH